MGKLIIPDRYRSSLDIVATQRAIKGIKDYFQINLAQALNLKRVSAPLFVTHNSGLNDNLNGIEHPVAFDMHAHKELGPIEIVQSLAKWKRMALHRYEFAPGVGLYTDMNAIRPYEETDNTHSIYVDQWDWELVMRKDERNLDFLYAVVRKIYDVLLRTEEFMLYNYGDKYTPLLPEDIYIVTSQELEDRWPDLLPSAREERITREKKAVFISQIGKTLTSGNPHDGRAPDYDDWELNGDIILWHPVLDRAMELSSMGIRVDADTLKKQLEVRSATERLQLPFHTMLSENRLPQTIGGGIGQSRICMFFMQKAHIGEVQASIWPESMVRACHDNGINLL